MNDNVFRAMADPTRRKILRLLKDGPLTAGEIADQFQQAQPTISRHLQTLRHAGLISDERQGSYVIYRMNTTVVQSWLTWIWEYFGRENQDDPG